MKRLFRLITIVTLCLALSNCKKPGPDGPDGPDSPDGPVQPDNKPASGNDTGAGNYGGSGSDEIPGPGGEEGLTYNFEFTGGTVALSQELADHITNTGDSRFAIPWDSSEHSLKNGDVVVIPACEAYPEGYIAIIEGTVVSEDGKTCTLNIRQGELGDAFRQLHLSQTGLDISDYAKEIIGPDGSTIPFTKAGGGIAIKIPEMMGLTSIGVDIGKNLTITPSMEVNFKMDIGCDVVDCAVTYARMRIDAGARLAADVTVKKALEKDWTSHPYKIVFAAIPVGPVIITPEVYLSFYVKLSGEVNLTFSVNYSKSYAAVAMYDGEFHSQAAETTASSGESPFNVSGNMSGSIEFGPNIGVGISAYGGALGLGVDFDPHLVLATTLSVPFNAATMGSYDNIGYYLAGAYFEPQMKFGFGATMSIAYKWTKHIEVPDNVALIHSFGKNYFLPSLGKIATTSFANNIFKFESHILHDPLYSGQMYLKVTKNAADPENDYFSIPLSAAPFPANSTEQDSVACTAAFPMDGLKEGDWFNVYGPYMQASIMGMDADFEMAPCPTYRSSYHVVNPAVERAVRSILADIRKSAGNEWQDCNWDDPDAGLNTWTNVSFRMPDEAEDGTPAYFVEIYLPSHWKCQSSISISDHSSALAKGRLKWSLASEDLRQLSSFTVRDQGFYNYYGFEVSNSISIHSREFTYFTPTLTHNSTCSVDLSESGVISVDNYCQDYYTQNYETAPTYITTGVFKLDNCPELHSISIKEALPSSLSFENCPKMSSSEMKLENINNLAPLSSYKGSGLSRISITGNTETESLTLDGNNLSVKNAIYVYTQGLQNLTITNQSALEKLYVTDWYHPDETALTASVSALSVSSCSSLKEIAAYDLASLAVSGCPALERLSALHFRKEDELDTIRWKGRLSSISVSGTPNLYYVEINSAHLGGNMPSWLIEAKEQASARGYLTVDYPWKYEYKDWRDDEGNWQHEVLYTHSSGYYYPGEPSDPKPHPMSSQNFNDWHYYH